MQHVLQYYREASWKAMLRITRFQTCLATNQVAAVFVNADFWLDKIAREFRLTQQLHHLLKNKFAKGR